MLDILRSCRTRSAGQAEWSFRDRTFPEQAEHSATKLGFESLYIQAGHLIASLRMMESIMCLTVQ